MQKPKLLDTCDSLFEHGDYIYKKEKIKYFDYLFQSDMLMSLQTQKATVNDDDLKKHEEFTNDFGQEG